VPAFLAAAVLMAAGAATLWFWPFQPVADMDRSLVRWPEPQFLISADRDTGPVLVRITYTIAADQEQQFRQIMAPLRQSRRQTATDLRYHDDAAALSDPPSQTDHYLATDVREEQDR
jgi:hypothetical protein